MWWLLSGPVFYRAVLARVVILIEEAWKMWHRVQ
jgi:hypothetical protein